MSLRESDWDKLAKLSVQIVCFRDQEHKAVTVTAVRNGLLIIPEVKFTTLCYLPMEENSSADNHWSPQTSTTIR